MPGGLLGCVLLASVLAGCDEPPQPRADRVAVVADEASDYWIAARDGVEEAEGQFHVACEFRLPTHATVELQTRIIDDLLRRRVPGMAICPVDAEAQSARLEKTCRQMRVVCIRRDAPESHRLCFVGNDDEAAGRMLAAYLAEALQPGATLLILTSQIDQPPERDRLAGLLKALPDPDSWAIEKIVADKDMESAGEHLQKALNRAEMPAGLVGLRREHGPLIQQASSAGWMPDDLVVVCSDDSLDTLRAIEAGWIRGAVVSQPAEVAFHAVRILTSVLSGDESAVPPTGRFLVSPVAIDRTTVDILLDRAGEPHPGSRSMPTSQANGVKTD